jgi:ribosomal-protein-serine acetyltransferase
MRRHAPGSVTAAENGERARGRRVTMDPMRELPDYLETDRLVLRTWQPEDAEALELAITASLEHLLPWMPWAASEPLAVDDRRTLIRGWEEARQEGRDLVLGVFLDGAVVGGTGLHQRIGPNGIEIGYWIHVDHVRQGYATELAGALTELAFTFDHIERVEIHHDRANIASGAVPRALGYELVAEKPDAVDAPGEEGVDCTWVVARDRWQSRGRSVGN